MADLSSILPAMPTYFGAQLPAPAPASGSSPLMDALRTVTAVNPAVPQNPYSMVPPPAAPPANPRSYFGAALPTLDRGSQPTARQAAASAPVPTATPQLPPPAPSTSDIAHGSVMAAPNVIQGGVPGATTPSEVPGMLHPADHAIAYAQHLATQRDIQPFNGANVNEFTTLDANSPRMEGPPVAAPNIIRGGALSGGAPNGMNLMQLEALRPMIQARQEATQLNPTLTIPNELMAMAKYRRDQRIASKEDPTKVMADYEGELYRIHNQTLALIQALAQH